MEFEWEQDKNRAVECIQAGPYEIRIGDRVRLRPRRRADIMDIALAGRVATIEKIEIDFDDRCHLAVVLDDDPGAELGFARQIGHRFFFGPEEVEPLGAETSADGPAAEAGPPTEVGP